MVRTATDSIDHALKGEEGGDLSAGSGSSTLYMAGCFDLRREARAEETCCTESCPDPNSWTPNVGIFNDDRIDDCSCRIRKLVFPDSKDTVIFDSPAQYIIPEETVPINGNKEVAFFCDVYVGSLK